MLYYQKPSCVHDFMVFVGTIPPHVLTICTTFECLRVLHATMLCCIPFMLDHVGALHIYVDVLHPLVPDAACAYLDSEVRLWINRE